MQARQSDEGICPEPFLLHLRPLGTLTRPERLRLPFSLVLFPCLSLLVPPNLPVGAVGAVGPVGPGETGRGRKEKRCAELTHLVINGLTYHILPIPAPHLINQSINQICKRDRE